MAAERKPVRVTNAEMAAQFMELAELLELKDGQRYKSIAYERAARVIAGWPEPVEEIWRRGQLKSLPGVGDSIAHRIGEMIETGQMQVLQELRSEFPAQITTLPAVPGIGPHKANTLYRTLGIGTLDELEEACRTGQIALAKGFNTRSAAKLLQGIERLRSRATRLLLAEAWDLADRIELELKRLPQVQQASVAGAVRRREAVVEDLIVVASSDDLASVTQAVGGGIIRGVTPDIRIVPPASFGAVLLLSTGPRGHLEALAARGLPLDVAALAERGESEAALYGSVGLPWIPPELRYDGSEIAYIEQNGVPDLIELSDIKGDLHAHTAASDGVASIEQMARGARARGYQYLAITDHSRSLRVAGGLSIEELDAQLQQIAEFNRKSSDFRILSGCECDILPDGSMDFPDEVLARLDIVVGSIHGAFAQDPATQTSRLIRAMENPHVDIIGHPTGRLLSRRDGYGLEWDRLLEAARRTGTALEINSSPNRLDMPDSAGRSLGPAGFVSIDSDAHSVAQLRYMPYGVAVARRSGLSKSQVINALTAEALLSRRSG